ncbi:MAG: hypothetical protein K2G49_11460 [Muribaculum sp.]|nr:hypothetical protein [Muribaculum sp.]
MKKFLLFTFVIIASVGVMAEQKVDLRRKESNNKHRNESVPPVECAYDEGVLSVKIFDDSNHANLKAKDAFTGEIHVKKTVYGNSEVTLSADNVVILEVEINGSKYEGYLMPQ